MQGLNIVSLNNKNLTILGIIKRLSLDRVSAFSKEEERADFLKKNQRFLARKPRTYMVVVEDESIFNYEVKIRSVLGNQRKQTLHTHNEVLTEKLFGWQFSLKMVRNYLGNMKMEIVILFGIFETFERKIP